MGIALCVFRGFFNDNPWIHLKKEKNDLGWDQGEKIS